MDAPALVFAAPLQYSGDDLARVAGTLPTLAAASFASMDALRKYVAENGGGHVLDVQSRAPDATFRLELSAAAAPNANGNVLETLYVVRPTDLDGVKGVLCEAIASLAWGFTTTGGDMSQWGGARASLRHAMSVVVTDKGRMAARSGYTVRACDADGSAGSFAAASVYDAGIFVGFVRLLARPAGYTKHVGLHAWWR